MGKMDKLFDGADHDYYPAWVCSSCGAKYGRRRCGTACWHVGTCGICGIEASVTEPRDFGHLQTDWRERYEQEARIKALEAEAADRESFIKTLADTCTEAERIAIERAGRIDALESECRKLRDALSETEAFCNRKDITIERQRKVIKSAKTALEYGLEYVQQALTDFDNQYRHHPAVENERVLLVKDVEELTAALSAIAELEKGVG